jgi:predicted Zn-dependent protease
MTEENQVKDPDKNVPDLQKPMAELSLAEFMAAGEQYFAQGKYDEAIAASREYLARRPDALSPRLFLGRCYLEKEMNGEAKAELESVVRSIEECLSVYKILSQVYLKEKDVDKALEALRKALFFSSAEEPSSKRITPLEMGLLQRDSPSAFVTPPIQVAEAQGSGPAAETALRKTPIQTDTLAEIYIKQGHLQKALSIYQEILAREPENASWREKVETLKGKLEGEGKKEGKEKVLRRLQSWLGAVEKKTPTAPA